MNFWEITGLLVCLVCISWQLWERGSSSIMVHHCGGVTHCSNSVPVYQLLQMCCNSCLHHLWGCKESFEMRKWHNIMTCHSIAGINGLMAKQWYAWLFGVKCDKRKNVMYQGILLLLREGLQWVKCEFWWPQPQEWYWLMETNGHHCNLLYLIVHGQLRQEKWVCLNTVLFLVMMVKKWW